MCHQDCEVGHPPHRAPPAVAGVGCAMARLCPHPQPQVVPLLSLQMAPTLRPHAGLLEEMEKGEGSLTVIGEINI